MASTDRRKPFSVSTQSPLRFVIKKRGAFTSAITSLKKGDKVYSRGPYGKKLDVQKSSNALLLAGGSGVAVLPLIANDIKKKVDNVSIKVAIAGDRKTSKSDFSDNMFSILEKYGDVEYVYDDGVLGRMINNLSQSDIKKDMRAYIVGPMAMMTKAAERLVSLGLDSDCIYLSVESLTLCGIGMCGECVCASKLPCKEGTFYKYSELQEKNK